jgi:proteasome accessory factor C
MSRITASQRLQRLLALIPWVAEHDGPTVKEVCARFEVRPSELLDELSLVSLVGLPPYTPDELFDVVVEDDRVWVHLSPSFDRSLRLTPEQALTIVASGASLRSIPGHDPTGPLERGLAKLAASLGVDPDAVIDVDLGHASGAVIDEVRRGVAEHRRLRLDYYTAGRDEHTVREVDPYRLWADQGQWYLLGHDHLRGDERVFRVDRILDAELLAEPFDPPDDDRHLGLFQADDSDPRVVLDLAPDAAWVVEAHPVEAVEQGADGRLRVTIAVGAPAWLERLLLRLGPRSWVADGGSSPELVTCGAEAAGRIRARYNTPPTAV